jgi:hypothetical protein
LGRLYINRYFPPEVKAQVQSMVTNLIAVYRNRLNSITWMAPATKAEAIAKLATLYVGIGYPEHWDEDNFEVKPDDVFGNLWRSRLARYQHERSLLGTVVDRERWVMSPQTINAVNPPLQNGLNFPAAILPAPSFDPHASAAANYAAIGAVIGHEISHTLDSEGSAFDSKGRLRSWWTPEDFAHFNAATAKLVAQYDAYKPFPDLSLNGKQTLAENIADVAGLVQPTTPTRLRFTASPLPSRTASMAINSSTSLLRNRGQVNYATRRCATRFLPTRIRPTTGARSRSVTKTHGTRRSMSNPATNFISRRPIVCRSGSNSRTAAPFAIHEKKRKRRSGAESWFETETLKSEFGGT